MQVVAGRLEHGVEHIGEPELLEGPGAQERGDAGVLVGRRDEQVAHALHGRALEVAQQAEQADGVGAEPGIRDLGEVEFVAVAAVGGARELADVEASLLERTAVGEGCLEGDLLGDELVR